jgi:hypothetical protein
MMQAEGFESFLIDHFFDLHYQIKPDAHPISLGSRPFMEIGG